MSSLLQLAFLLFVTKVTSFVLKVDTMNAGEMTTGERAKYLLTLTLTNDSEVSVYITLPYNTTSLFTVSSVEISEIGANLVLPQPLSKPVFKAATNNAGNDQAVWSLGMVARVNEVPAESFDDDLVLRVIIQAQDHPKMISNSTHWLNFAAVYDEKWQESQYVVKKPVTVRSGEQKFVKVDLRLNSTFQSSHDSSYSAGQTRSFVAEIFHHHDSRAPTENLELNILTQDYLKLESVILENSFDHTYTVTNTTGHTIIKISHLNLYQTLSFKISMTVGVFTPKISRSKTNDPNFTNNVIAELHYYGLSPDICQQDTPVQIVVKTFDYQVVPVFSEEDSLNEPFPLIKTLDPPIKCSSCGFYKCCSSRNVTINSLSYWMPFSVEDKQQFLEFDFRTAIMLKTISLQGSGQELNAFVTSFSLMSSNDGIRWTTQIYRGKKQIYQGNSDSESVVVRNIKPVLKSRYVRIIPLTWRKRAALRLEFFIKPEDIVAFQIYGTKVKRCVGSAGGITLHQLECSSTNSLDRWIWTDHEQLLNLKMSSCLSREADGSVQLQSCDPNVESQKWHCADKDKLVSRSDNSILYLGSDLTVALTTIESSTKNDTVRIYSNKKSVCSEKGGTPLALRQMLWNKHDAFFVCDLNSRSEETINHCMYTTDDGNTWQDLDVQLFGLLGISQDKYMLYGVTFGQKNALTCEHYGYSICRNILKSDWEKIKRNTTLMEIPVNIPFIPFGETQDSEMPREEMTLRSLDRMPAWGASSAGIHRRISGQWNLVLSWSKLGTRYARPGSCKQILAFGQSSGDGIYTIYPAHPLIGIKAYCDMTRDGGGWTLLVTSKTPYWTISQVLEHTPEEPSISNDHSILQHADDIKTQSEEDCFEYRLEAKEFGQYGGIWRAPKAYSFVARNNTQTDVRLVKKFSNWEYHHTSIEKRMPWVCEEAHCHGILTTSAHDSWFYGSIVCDSSCSGGYVLPAPWMMNEQISPGIIWYWIREGGC